MAAESTWWGVTEVGAGSAHWRLGPLELIVRRRPGELQLGVSRVEGSADPDDETGQWERTEGDESPETLDHVERFILRGTSGEVELMPALADRPVVTSPRLPLTILPGEEATLLVGSPLWVRLSGGSPRVQLAEMPLRRPSDTWFGPVIGHGELCYGTTTQAILHSENLPRLYGRAITPVQIHNLADEPLPILRLKLPVPRLSLYAAAGGKLWTERIVLARHAAEEVASVEVDSGSPAEAGEGAERLAEPRETPEAGALERVFGGLFRRAEAE